MPNINARRVRVGDTLRVTNGTEGRVVSFTDYTITITPWLGPDITDVATHFHYNAWDTAPVDTEPDPLPTPGNSDELLVTLATRLTELSAAVDQLIMDNLLGGMA